MGKTEANSGTGFSLKEADVDCMRFEFVMVRFNSDRGEVSEISKKLIVPELSSVMGSESELGMPSKFTVSVVSTVLFSIVIGEPFAGMVE